MQPFVTIAALFTPAPSPPPNRYEETLARYVAACLVVDRVTIIQPEVGRSAYREVPRRGGEQKERGRAKKKQKRRNFIAIHVDYVDVVFEPAQ